MASIITRTQIRQEIIRRLPSLGRVLVADSITKAGPSLTHVSEYERQRAGLTTFEGQYVHRYNLADPDRWRRITTLNSGATDGVINVDGPAYVDNADMNYERLGIHPDVLNGFIAEAQRRQRVRTNIALIASGTTDLDMETSGVGWWDGSFGGSAQVATTLTKIASDVRSGTQALNCVTTNATNHVYSEVIRTTNPSGVMFCGIIFRASVLTGTFSFSLRDAVSGAVVGTPQTISGIAGGDWLFTRIQTTVPAGTNSVQVVFSTNNAGDNYTVDTVFGPYLAGQTDFTLQSGIDEAYKLRAVRPSTFKIPLTTNANFFNAQSLEYQGDFTSPENYVVEAFRRDANASRLRFIPSVYFPDPLTSPGSGYGSGFGGLYPTVSQSMRPVWLAMEAQVSDFEPMLTETSTTSQPLDVCASWTIKLLAEYIMGRNPTPYWQGVWNEYKSYAAYEEMLRPPQPLMPQRRYHQVRI